MRNNNQQFHTSELLNLATRHHKSGKIKQAELIYKKILETDPNHPDALHLLGVVMHHSGKLDVAVNLIKKAIEVDYSQSFYFNNLGNVYNNLGKLIQAAQCFKKALDLKPDYPEAYYGLANTYRKQSNLDDAASCYKKALQLNLCSVEAHFEMGQYFENTNSIDEAILCYQKVAQSDSVNSNSAYMKLGILYGKLDRLSEAIFCFQKVLETRPESAIVNYNLGLAYQKQHIFDQAILAYQKALAINSNYTDANFNMGAIRHKQGNIDQAIYYYQKAIQLKPDYAPIYNNLGLAFQKQNKIDEATQWFEKSLSLDPNYSDALSHLVHHLQHTCDWKKLAPLSGRLDVFNQKAIDGFTRTPEAPFINLTRHADPALNCAVARSWVNDIARRISNTNIHFPLDNRRLNKKKITIGYLSNNFGNHPVAHLMQNLYGLHDRNNFEIICYSYGKDDGDHYRKKIEQECDKFIDLFQLSHLDSAKYINEDQVDILVDLVGHTEDNRFSISAYRPAPVQVSFLGFLGTSGADFIDYIITDRIVTPEHHARFYSENFVYMPHTYQINDNTAAISEHRLKKHDFRLPENSFVFCSFNKSYKIEPVMFDSWMKILRKVDQSILWLICGGKTAERNLRRAAELGGVDPAKLIFAEMIALEDHLERLKLADLALDTRTYNGGATTSNALWAGVPLIALRGNHFVSRMSASSLTAVGLPELIVSNLKEYEALAVGLAKNPEELNSITLKLEKNRLTAPMFDTPRFVHNLEKAYRQMWEIFLSGENARPINVLDSEGF